MQQRYIIRSYQPRIIKLFEIIFEFIFKRLNYIFIALNE